MSSPAAPPSTMSLSASRGQGVAAAVGVLDRLDHAQRDRLARELRQAGRGSRDPAAVADHHVVAVAGVDRVAEAPADDDVLAGAAK